MDARALAASSASFDRSQASACASVTAPRADSTRTAHGAYSAADSRRANVTGAEPFFQDQLVTLSRPARLSDYQADSAAYPFRTMTPEDIQPYVPKAIPPPEMPKMVFTSEAEQKWLQERDARAAQQFESASASSGAKDFSVPPPPFVSKLGFRSPEPPPPQPKPITEFCHRDGVSKEFFWGGVGRASENGTANSQKYYALARPLGGRGKSHMVSETTPYGYKFDQYTNRP